MHIEVSESVYIILKKKWNTGQTQYLKTKVIFYNIKRFVVGSISQSKIARKTCSFHQKIKY